MRILVTGACGFIGSRLSESLVIAGHEVTGFCQYNSLGSTGWLPPNMCEVVHGDVRDEGTLMKAMHGKEMVFHLAALIGIPYSYTAPQSYIDTNVTGTHHVLDAAMENDCRVVVTSTSEVYGSCQQAPMSESHPLHAQSPYAASKIAADQLALSFHRSFGTEVMVLRPFNTYGPRQSARAVIPTLITQILDAKDGGDVHVGNTQAMRDWVFVEDTVRGFISCIENFHAGEVVNVATGVAWKVEKVAELICGLLQKKVRFVCDESRVRPALSEVDRLIGDNRKAAELLGWKQSVTMLDGLKRTILWFQENRSRYQSGYAV